MKHRQLSGENILNRTLLFLIMSVLLVLGFVLLVSGLAILLGDSSPVNSPVFIGLIVVLLILVFNPLRNVLQKQVDALFFREQKIRNEYLQLFSQELTRVFELATVSGKLRQFIQQGLSPTSLHIFLHDPISDRYVAVQNENGKPTTELRFQANSQILQKLANLHTPIAADKSDIIKSLPHSDRSRLALLDAQILAPLTNNQHISGWVTLGPKQAGIDYSADDLTYLGSLCDSASAAIERAQIVASLENRVREMDVLSRVAQGVNITPDFDNILELVFAQISQIIPCTDMRITLQNRASNFLYHAFYLENNERIKERESKPIPAGEGLEEEVVRSQRSLNTDDYHQECRSLGVLPATQWVYAWMSVPLNAGAETIGVISLGSRDPMLIYTEQQRNLLQSICDLAAGAIIKTRLIDETDQRARQLNTLNEIGRSLTSTLEINSLLNLILQNAAEILNCEAGSLFMIDDQTGELVFEVTAGPVAENLVGQRLPPGTGIVGRAVETGKPEIANDARRSVSWSDQTDKQTGFVTRDLLVVPMQVKERIIGVIEIINKKDGSPFNNEDQELLSTFASQAAIAIENARLYTHTDKALSERVEELSVMQRIDRELNASLELERALRITLDWAIRQTHADAGLVGLIEMVDQDQQSSIRISASQGFPERLEKQANPFAGFESYITLLEIPALKFVLQEGQPYISRFSPESPKISPQPESQSLPEEGTVDAKTEEVTLSHGLLSESMGQIIIPIRRRTEVIGMMLLESKQADLFSKETVAFLSRLSDHAAIAISNAQFYADLQNANIAKSEFVSLVSHELKTPMTSIKGYADLLAKGTVGPVNEIQTNFLNTIRSNVNRMSTLVSDLADISRIEAGRMRLEFNSLSIAEVVSEVVCSTQAQVDEKEQTLVSILPDDLPRVWGDTNRIIQVLANLVSNATKYTPTKGRITISAEHTENQWDSKGAPNVVVVKVTDTGYGIAPEDQKKIFQKFFRSEDQNIREASGTGLGLNITRHLIEMQGGKIWFESDYGKGTQFSFTVPVAATI